MAQALLKPLLRYPFLFLAVFFVVFFPSLLALAMLDAPLVPVLVATADESGVSRAVRVSEEPIHIFIPSVGIDAPIGNPESTSVAVLDAELTKGAVRYPDSGLLGEERNLFLFGHSSFLPNIRNPAYQTFNRLEKVQIGDEILVHSGEREHRYRIISVAKVDADEALVDFTSTRQQLTLSTCDSFGKKTERFVVVADFVESHPLANQ